MSFSSNKKVIRLISGLLGLFVVALCLFYYLQHILRYRNSFHQLLDPVLLFSLWIPSILIYCAGMLASALLWAHLLRDGRQTVSLSLVFSIYFQAQFAKYIPGNVAQHLGRLYLSTKHGLPAKLVIQSQILELAVTASGAACLSCFFLIKSFSPGHSGDFILLLLLQCGFLALMYFISLAIEKKIFLHILYRKLFSKLPPRTLFSAAFYPCAIFSLMGLMTVITSYGFDPSYSRGIAFATAAFAVSWVLGFVSPGAPAGLGVRDALLLTLLKQVMPADAALLTCIALRLTTCIGDLVCLITGLFLKNRCLPASTAPLSS